MKLADGIVTQAAGPAGQPDFAQIQGMAHVQRARLLRIQGDLGGAEAAAREALRVLESVGYVSGQAQAMLVLGEIFSDQAKLPEFERACRDAIDLARSGDSGWVEARGLTLLATCCVYQGKVEEAYRYKIGRAHV